MSVAPLLAALLGGTLLTFLWEREASLLDRIAAGTPLGLALLGLGGMLLGARLGVTSTTAWLAAGAAAAPVLMLLQSRARERLRRDLVQVLAGSPRRLAPGSAAWVLLVSAGLWAVFDRAMFEEAGAIRTGVDHNIGDLPFHIGVITSFAERDNLPPEHPELAGVRLTYPILADFVVSLLLESGMGLGRALLLENLLLALALSWLYYRFAEAVSGDQAAGRLALPLLFLSGGLGALLFVQDFWRSGRGVLQFLEHLPRDYTITWTGELRWGNVLTTLLVPQRALLLGAPLAVAVWTLWWRALADGDPAAARRRLAGAGALTGLLPLAHAHAFVVTVGLGACLALVFRQVRAWLPFFVLALGLGLPQVAWLAAGSAVRAGSVLAWQPGWDSGGRNALWFWFTNSGLLLPLLGVALWRARSQMRARFYAPFLLLFLVPNLLKLSPWIWDNIKFLFFWHLASLPLVAALLTELWRRTGLARLAALALGASLMVSGGLDVWRVASRQIEIEVFGADAAGFALGPLRATSARALILHAPTHNSPVYLAGRRSLLGYPGHIWSQGLDAGSREAEIRSIYEGSEDAAFLLRRHAVDYILVGPQERAWAKLDEAGLRHHPLVAESHGYRLLKAR